MKRPNISAHQAIDLQCYQISAKNWGSVLLLSETPVVYSMSKLLKPVMPNKPTALLFLLLLLLQGPAILASGNKGYQGGDKKPNSLALPELIPYRDGQLWGYADSTGAIRIRPQFYSAGLFSHGFAKVNISATEENLINKYGGFLLPEHYERIDLVNENMVVVKNYYNLTGLYATAGYQILAPKYQNITVTPINYRSGSNEEFYLLYAWRTNETGSDQLYSGIINGVGNTVLPLERHHVTYKGAGIIKIEKEEKTRYFTIRGEPVSGLNEYKVGDFHQGLAWIQKDTLCGFADSTGAIIIQVKYNWVSSFNNGVAKVGLNHKNGFVNSKGEEVVPLIYDKIEWLWHGIYYATINGKYGLMDASGNRLTQIKYDNLSMIDAGKSFAFYEKGKKPTYGVINFKSGSPVLTVVSNKESSIGRFEGETARFFKPEKNSLPRVNLPTVRFYRKRTWIFKRRKRLPRVSISGFSIYRSRLTGLINDEWKIIIPAMYENVEPMKFGLAPVKIKGYWGVVNEYNELIIPPRYYHIHIVEHDVIRVTKSIGGDYNYGIYNRKGEAIIPSDFNRIFYNKNGNFTLFQGSEREKNVKVGLADKSGNFSSSMLSPPEDYTIRPHEEFRNGLIRVNLQERKVDELNPNAGNPKAQYQLYWGYMDRYGRAYFKN